MVSLLSDSSPGTVSSAKMGIDASETYAAFMCTDRVIYVTEVRTRECGRVRECSPRFTCSLTPSIAAPIGQRRRVSAGLRRVRAVDCLLGGSHVSLSLSGSLSHLDWMCAQLSLGKTSRADDFPGVISTFGIHRDVFSLFSRLLVCSFNGSIYTFRLSKKMTNRIVTALRTMDQSR